MCRGLITSSFGLQHVSGIGLAIVSDKEEKRNVLRSLS